MDPGAQRAGARPVDGAVDDDAVQPRTERPAAVEAVERAHGGEKRFLRDVLGAGCVVDDEVRGAVRARPVRAVEPLHRVDGAGLRGPDQRAVIVLRYLLEYTPGEIAELLDLPRGTVNSRLRRGLDRMKEATE